ncbi:hypothetical protein E2C01_034627 [Portunus trituberculatus]|uniref:Uncharacterized protein n=1 Tax=Portunus trituberculatus TaxID=210409 RepID=A0A5B7F6T8_PORTR|nr:hypothetical protein [Portunus trituberculatus]
MAAPGGTVTCPPLLASLSSGSLSVHVAPKYRTCRVEEEDMGWRGRVVMTRVIVMPAGGGSRSGNTKLVTMADGYGGETGR